MTYASPSSGEQVGLSFITPRSVADLDARRGMMRRWAQVSCGMMGRTPDFLNVSLMAMAEAGDYFAEDRPEFGENIRRYYEWVREEDLVLTHTLVNLQRSRAATEQILHDNTEIALSVVKETDSGIVVHGGAAAGYACRLRTRSRCTRRGRTGCPQEAPGADVVCVCVALRRAGAEVPVP